MEPAAQAFLDRCKAVIQHARQSLQAGVASAYERLTEVGQGAQHVGLHWRLSYAWVVALMGAVGKVDGW